MYTVFTGYNGTPGSLRFTVPGITGTPAGSVAGESKLNTPLHDAATTAITVKIVMFPSLLLPVTLSFCLCSLRTYHKKVGNR